MMGSGMGSSNPGESEVKVTAVGDGGRQTHDVHEDAQGNDWWLWHRDTPEGLRAITEP